MRECKLRGKDTSELLGPHCSRCDKIVGDVNADCGENTESPLGSYGAGYCGFSGARFVGGKSTFWSFVDEQIETSFHKPDRFSRDHRRPIHVLHQRL